MENVAHQLLLVGGPHRAAAAECIQHVVDSNRVDSAVLEVVEHLCTRVKAAFQDGIAGTGAFKQDLDLLVKLADSEPLAVLVIHVLCSLSHRGTGKSFLSRGKFCGSCAMFLVCVQT